MLAPAATADKAADYEAALKRIGALLGYREDAGENAGENTEDDWVAAMATVACELHHTFDHYDWTGFYRVVADDLLKVGPYQGGHGCLSIPFDRGVCGAAARERRTQLVPDVEDVPSHIACSSSTRSEIVVPVITAQGCLLAVLDVDSDRPDAFDDTDREHLEALCQRLGEQFAPTV
jgi:GAF domain-containing protein